jgi:3-oxoacyl-[acyl-carrier protein] reductase
MDLNGKVALVTGGGTGLGREISLQLAHQGMDIAVNYSRSEADAEQTVHDIKELGRRAIAVRADVSVDSQVKEMAQRVESELGRIDVLVNNAGYTVFVPFPDLDKMEESEWDRILDVNTKGPFLCSRAVAPAMQRQGAGRIINVTSISGLRAGGSSIAYAVSKAGEQMLARCLALALAPTITVNTIAPGIMDTRWGRLWGDEAIERMAADSPLKRVPGLDDIAAAAVFLAKNGSMTRQTIVIDAGRHMPL